MNVNPVPPSRLLPYGVYRLPILGANGEIILVAVDRAHRLSPSSPYVVPATEDPADSFARLTVELECLDGSSAQPATPKARQRKPSRRALEEWLRADMAGTARGVEGGDAAISNAQWASLAEAAEERRRRWPKP